MNLILSPHNVTLTKAIEDHLIRGDVYFCLSCYRDEPWARLIVGHDQQRSRQYQSDHRDNSHYCILHLNLFPNVRFVSG